LDNRPVTSRYAAMEHPWEAVSCIRVVRNISQMPQVKVSQLVVLLNLNFLHSTLPQRLQKSSISILTLIWWRSMLVLDGAAVHRCDKSPFSNGGFSRRGLMIFK